MRVLTNPVRRSGPHRGATPQTHNKVVGVTHSGQVPTKEVYYRPNAAVVFVSRCFDVYRRLRTGCPISSFRTSRVVREDLDLDLTEDELRGEVRCERSNEKHLGDRPGTSTTRWGIIRGCEDKSGQTPIRVVLRWWMQSVPIDEIRVIN